MKKEKTLRPKGTKGSWYHPHSPVFYWHRTLCANSATPLTEGSRPEVLPLFPRLLQGDLHPSPSTGLHHPPALSRQDLGLLLPFFACTQSRCCNYYNQICQYCQGVLAICQTNYQILILPGKYPGLTRPDCQADLLAHSHYLFTIPGQNPARPSPALH